jgi:hypothetical protein
VRESHFVRLQLIAADNKRRIMMTAFTLPMQIAEVEREIALRESAYPRFVGSGKMKQDDADLHMAQMKAVLKTLQWLKLNETSIREALSKKLEQSLSSSQDASASDKGDYSVSA